GMTVPYFAIEIARHRLIPAHFNRSVILAEMHSPRDAIEPGFLDRVVPSDQVVRTAQESAAAMSALDMTAHAATKLRARGATLTALRHAIESELTS
ncbi:MAG: enoyl-CoA hydratase, partial [Deltaproteobacteria bacterium]|nr:enoyl-CoA hydratase [Deltaproteobacteria bacterium]